MISWFLLIYCGTYELETAFLGRKITDKTAFTLWLLFAIIIMTSIIKAIRKSSSKFMENNLHLSTDWKPETNFEFQSYIIEISIILVSIIKPYRLIFVLLYLVIGIMVQSIVYYYYYYLEYDNVQNLISEEDKLLIDEELKKSN